MTTIEQATLHRPILLVDDEPDLLRVTRQWLVTLGYEVTALSDANHDVTAISPISWWDELKTRLRSPSTPWRSIRSTRVPAPQRAGRTTPRSCTSIAISP